MRALLLSVFVLGAPALADDADFAALRADLVDEVRVYAGYAGDDPFSDAVLEAMGRVERHKFVPQGQVRYAYENRPLPIGHGQTISQPYIVALMTDLLEPADGDVVLEVGTGSGYQAAIAAKVAGEVYSVEIFEVLALRSRRVLDELKFSNVYTRQGDGYYGWEEKAPFDAIIVTCAGGHIPPPLLRQLKPGGRMIMPVGGPFMTQNLVFLEKQADGSVSQKNVLPVAFVRLLGH